MTEVIVKIKIGEKEVILDQKEAQQLFYDLKNIFEKNTYIYPNIYDGTPWIYPYRTYISTNGNYTIEVK